MQLLSAKPVIEALQTKTSSRVQQFIQKTKRKPKLVVVLVGDDPASVIYTSNKGKQALAVGMDHETVRFPANALPQEVFDRLRELNADPSVDGILIQRPLPSSFNETEVLEWVLPEKDVDAFHPLHAGRLSLGLPGLVPCTPLGVIRMLEYYQISISGKNACVIGRSSIVGKPMASLLLQRNATLIQCHSHTRDLSLMTKLADILVVAAGKPLLINSSHVKPGAVVIDVGIHRNDQGKIIGDVDFDSVSQVASALTPVPGGVGPMTISLLLENTIRAAHLREGLPFPS